MSTKTNCSGAWSFRLYGVSFDPKQRADLLKVKHNDKIAPSAHTRLSKILSRFPKQDAAAPFPEYGKRHAGAR